MNQKKPGDITFQITVGQLTLLTQLPKQDFHVVVCIDDVSKITCSGDISEDGLTVSWNHAFLFSASPSTTVGVSICSLPEELSPEWDKQPLGDQIVTTVASLLESGNEWKCNIPILSIGPATLSMTSITCDALIEFNGHKCFSALQKYSGNLYMFARYMKNIPCISTAIEMYQTMLDFCPLGHPYHTGLLNDLSAAYSLCYAQTGNISDLSKAIEIKQTRLDLCPLGHPEHAKALGALAHSLQDYYSIQKNRKDLSRIIEMQEKWLNMCPQGHSDHARALSELASSLSERYHTLGNKEDLNKAIGMRERALELCPTEHSYHGVAMTNLAASIFACYQKQGNLADLNMAINLQEKYLELCLPSHSNYGIALRNLAVTLQNRYKVMKYHPNLINAITLLKEALSTYPVHHHSFASNVRQLAAAILLFSSSKEGYTSYDVLLDEAFEMYRLLKKCGPLVSSNLWKAIQAWVQDAEEHNHSSVLEAYQTYLNALDHITTFNPSLEANYEATQANLANNAFSYAIKNGNILIAVELLEQGRGILWRQLAHRTALESQGDEGHALLGKFTQLCADLSKSAEGRKDRGMHSYQHIHNEWNSVVDRIRCLNELSQFLHPPCFDNLQHAAECGPVIIVNACKYHCDALIVLHTSTPVHVSLPCTLSDVNQFCSQMSVFTQDAHAYDNNREARVKEMLRELWSSVVEPIASVLQNDIQLPTGSRIWWYLTSKFATLPLHAAGPYKKGEKNLMDLYISSYAPSFLALIRTRDRARSRKRICTNPGTANVISFGAVGQARASAGTRLRELVEVERELQRIRSETGMPANIAFETITGDAASIEGTVQAFRDHQWVHIACHGAQHAEKPFESWFAMGDGKLTLMRIIQERYANSEFAFLSACHTAVGDESTPDEVLHLAAGMQFAGFSGVVGTLWRVDDAVAHRFVTRFYQEMFKRPDIGFEHAAAALNTAAVETADEVSLEKRIVFVHIGI